MFRRVFWIVLDGVGAGALPDAAAWGDLGADTLGHIVAARGLDVPALAAMGLCRIAALPEPPCGVRGAWGRLYERSPGKDTTTGHWELAGLELERPFPVYPDGFPAEVVEAFEKAIGRKVLGNVPASGTEIIARLGELHVATGMPILYTSADSVFQIACHEDVVPPEQLYAMCRAARAILAPPHAVSRVIARPFTGRPGAFARTSRRRDFSLPPPGDTVLDLLKGSGLAVVGVGKIHDIFAGRGLTDSRHSENNAEAVEALLELAGEDFAGLCFANLVDFDMLYGHRRDPSGFGRALEEFDRALPILESKLRRDDLLLVSSDHGNDPLHPGSDHTREYVPQLAWHQGAAREVALGSLPMSDVGATVAANFGISTRRGSSFLELLALGD